MQNNSKGQTLFLVIVIMTIFAAIIVTIAGITARGLELRELEEASFKTSYAADSAMEKAMHSLGKGYSLNFDGGEDTYVEIRHSEGRDNYTQEDGYIHFLDNLGDTEDQITIELWIKINKWPEDGEFAVILGRGDLNDASTPNGIGRDFELAISGAVPPQSPQSWYKYCSNALHFRALVSYYQWFVGWHYRYVWFPVVAPLDPNSCQQSSDDLVFELNRWYHITINMTENWDGGGIPPAYYIWADGGDKEYTYGADGNAVFQTTRNVNIQRGNFPIYLGGPIPGLRSEMVRYSGTATEHKYSNFNGSIDGLRIYKHPPFCWKFPEESRPTFYHKPPPNDPFYHQKGIFDYEHYLPLCLEGNRCDSLQSGSCRNYYPTNPRYDMEDDLVLSYNFFEAAGTCTAENQEYCIRDGSGRGNDATIHGYDFSAGDTTHPFLSSGGAPRLSVLSNYIAGDPIVITERMNNGYTYSLRITPKGEEKWDGKACEDDYCIETRANSPY